MRLTKDIIKSLRDGDKVRVKHASWKYPWEGQIWVDRGATQIGGFSFCYVADDAMALWDLEILERAPRFYKNVDRAPVPGDVCRLDVPATTNASNSKVTWTFRTDGNWYPSHGSDRSIIGDFGIRQPVLIVDGETGLPVMPEFIQAELKQLRKLADR